MSTKLNDDLRASLDFEEQKPTGMVVQDKRSAAIERVAPQQSDALLMLIEKLSTNEALDVVKAEKMVELYLSGQRRMQEMQDERQYYERMAEFKRNPPEVVKRLTAKIQGTSKSGRDYAYEVPYADLNAYADAAMADLAERGITWDFEIIEAPDKMTVTCLFHYGLYTRRGSPATGDPKVLQSPNPLMQKGAAQSFLMRYSFCASSGLTAALPGDKNGVITPAEAESCCMEEGAAADFLSAIEGSGDVDQLQRNYFAARDAAAAAKDARATKVFAAAKDKIYRQLTKGAKRGN